MPKKKEVYISESAEYLTKLLRNSKSSFTKSRLKCILLLKSNKYSKRKDLANNLKITYSTLKKWITQYEKEGLDSFITTKHSSNRSSVISPQTHSLLEKKLKNCTDPLQSYTEAQRWISDLQNESIPYSTVNAYLKRKFGTKLKMPRKSHYKQDEIEVSSFKKPKN